MAPRKPSERPLPIRVLTAAAQQLKLNAKGKIAAPPREGWQGDAWDVFDLVPEASQAATFLANVVSGVRVFVAVRPDDRDSEPAVAGNEPGAADAWALLERLNSGSVQGGIAGLLRASVVNLKVPGECWLLGEPALDAIPDLPGRPGRPRRAERWDIKSTDEVEALAGGRKVKIKDRPGTEGRIVSVPPEGEPPGEEDVFLLRVWDRHPRYGALARSSLRAALGQCDELLLLGRCIRVAARRFLAGNGMLGIPQEMELPGPPSEGDPSEESELSPLMKKLATAMVEAMADESNPDSLVPVMTMAPGELLQKLQHISFGGALDAEVRELVTLTMGRLGAALDLPIEQLTGIAKVNHWGAWQIDGATWARYGQPTTRLILDSWTEGLLWPQLIDNFGVPEEAARRLCFWFDPSDAIMDPDESKTADELFDRGAISWEAYRRRKGANEDEAPTPEELAERAQLGLLRGRPTTLGEPVPNDGETPAAPAARLNGFHANGHRPVVAAASRRARPLGYRLAEVDRALRARIEEATAAALRRGLQSAGARVRSASQRSANITAAIAGTPNDLVCSRLGRPVVAAMALSDDDLLAAALDELSPRFAARVGQAQDRTRAMLVDEFELDESEDDELRRRQEDDRGAAWAWLSGALLAIGRERLYEPSVTAPAAGEFDASAAVPPGVVREALAQAGGGTTTGGSVTGGVATGDLVLSVWAQHGRVVGGWEWVYGDPSSRSRPFEAHLDLDGVQFSAWSDARLLVRPEDAWLGVTHYRPGDHDWCACDFVPLGPDETAPSDDLGPTLARADAV